jgi:hypothetical protein
MQQASLLQEARYANLCRIVVVNRAWERIPNADVLYAADPEFWDTYDTKRFRGERFTADKDSAKKYGLQRVRAKAHPGIEFDATTGIVNGLHSGQQAMNLAVHLGAAELVLVGYDFGASPTRNWHEPYPTAHMNRVHNYPLWHKDMLIAAEFLRLRAIDVANCSNRSTLTCFRRSNLERELGL